MTTAMKISAMFNDDGQKFHVQDGSEDGLSLTAACEDNGGERLSDGWDGERYDFPDGSCIVICGGGWDLGFDGCRCFCWPEANWGNHADDCDEGPSDD